MNFINMLDSLRYMLIGMASIFGVMAIVWLMIFVIKKFSK